MTADTYVKYGLVVLAYAALGAMVYFGKFDASTYTTMLVSGASALVGYHAKP